MTTIANFVDMSTQDCPEGCKEKLIVKDNGLAVCPTGDGGCYSDGCEGEGIEYRNADEVVDAAYARAVTADKVLSHLYIQRQNLSERIEEQQKRVKAVWATVKVVVSPRGGNSP